MGYVKHKLVDVPTAQHLKLGEMKESAVQGFEGKKILIANNNGKLYGVSTKCTHYGASLVNGVLSSDGSLTCPWHGACYKLKTGDVEDAPALNSLKSYDIIEDNGELFVNIKENEQNPFPENGIYRTTRREVTNPEEHTVIIGAGSGAIGCLESLVNNGYPGKISVLSSPDQTYPIDRTKLSKALITEEGPILLRNKEWFADCGINVYFETVKKVDFQGKTVFTEDGKEYRYTKVVIATGGKPKALPLPGFSPENAFLLRAIRDATKIVDAIGDGNKKVAVIGTSFIGMEVGNLLTKKNDVTMIGMSTAPMSEIMGEKVGRIFQGLLEKSGAKFLMNVTVERLSTSDEHLGKKLIHIKDRDEPLEADVVILGVGVKPATEFIPKDSVRILDDGSLKVDQHFRMDGLPNAYAIGDIATYPYWGPGTGMKNGKTDTRIEHWDVAQNAGRAAADHIVHELKHPGTKLRPKEFVPIFWSALGQQLRYCGNTINGYDDVILQGNPDEAKFVAYFTLEDTVVAVASMGSDPVVMKCVNLMKARKMPSKKDIQAGVNVLELKV